MTDMEPKMSIERGDYFEDCVVFSVPFTDKEEYFGFTFRLDFDLQKTFRGDVLFSVYNRNIMHSLLYEKKAIDSLPLIEALIETKTILIRAIYEDLKGEYLEAIDTFGLDSYDVDELVSIRDTVLNIINYGGGFGAIRN